jgi:hypothetical protein
MLFPLAMTCHGLLTMQKWVVGCLTSLALIFPDLATDAVFDLPTFLYNKNPHLIKSLVSTMLILWPQILTYIDPFSTLPGAGKMSQLCIKNQPLF